MSFDAVLVRLSRVMDNWGAWLVPLVTALLCVPFLQTLYWMGDEGLILGGAQRLIEGRRLYVDFFEVVPPLSFLATQAWLTVFGQTLISARLLLVLLAALIAYFTYRSTRVVSQSSLLSGAMVLAWAAMWQGGDTQLVHHWFSTALSSITLYALLLTPERKGPPLLAGIAAGAAMMATTTRGAYAVLAGLIIVGARRDFRSIMRFVAGAAIVPTLTLAYVLGHGELYAAIDNLLVFAATRYSDVQGLKFGTFSSIQTRPLVLIFPAAAVLAVWTCYKNWPEVLKDDRFRACCIFAVVGFVGCYPRPDTPHIIYNVPLALPLVGAGIARLRLSPRAAKIVGSVALCLVAPSLASYAKRAWSVLRVQQVHTAAGPVRFISPQGEAALLRRIATLPRTHRLTFYPYVPMMPFLSQRSQVSYVEAFVPGYTSPELYARACRDTADGASWVVIERSWTKPDMLWAIFPNLQEPQPREKRMFEQALRHGFDLRAVIGNYELRQRASLKRSDCAAIVANR